MAATPKYVIDANVFIQAKNLYYRFDFCGGFWDWLLAAHKAGVVCSTKKVFAELTKGNSTDLAHAWAKQAPASFFIEDSADPKVMTQYAKVMQWANGSTHFKAAAKAEFAKSNVADAFVLAAAMQHGMTIVTQEKANPAARAKIYLPDAAAAHQVQSIFVYDMLSKLTVSTFAMKP